MISHCAVLFHSTQTILSHSQTPRFNMDTSTPIRVAFQHFLIPKAIPQRLRKRKDKFRVQPACSIGAPSHVSQCWFRLPPFCSARFLLSPGLHPVLFETRLAPIAHDLQRWPESASNRMFRRWQVTTIPSRYSSSKMRWIPIECIQLGWPSFCPSNDDRSGTGIY